MNYTNDIQEYINLEIDVLKQLDITKINDALNLLNETRLK